MTGSPVATLIEVRLSDTNTLLLDTVTGDGVVLTRVSPSKVAWRDQVDREAQLLERKWVPALARMFELIGTELSRAFRGRSRRMARHDVRLTAADVPDLDWDVALARAQEMIDELGRRYQRAKESGPEALLNYLNSQYINATTDLYIDTGNVAAGGAAAKLGIDFNVDAAPGVYDAVMQRMNKTSPRIAKTTYDAIHRTLAHGIQQGLAIPDLAEAIRAVCKSMSKARAVRIARTETISAFNAGSRGMYDDMPPDVLIGYEWLARIDGRERPAHRQANGQKIARGMTFIVGGEQLRYPGDTNGSAGNVINCRCAIAPITDAKDLRAARVHLRSHSMSYAEVQDLLVRAALGADPVDLLLELRAGDVVGHKFHGNQYSGGGLRPASDEDRRRLRVPPAWTDVVVAEDQVNGVNGMLARGVDAKGRRQAIYSQAHTEAQAAKKYARTERLVRKLPALDAQLSKDAMDDDTAAAVMVMRRTGMRQGSTRDRGGEKQAYGATTLEARHVTLHPNGDVQFTFVGKKGVDIDIRQHDPELHAVLSKRMKGKSPDDKLFDTDAGATLSYLHQHAGREFNVKDLRTVKANAVALEAIKGMPQPKNKREFMAARKEIARRVSEQLGNTPTVALASYINPTVFHKLMPSIAAEGAA